MAAQTYRERSPGAELADRVSTLWTQRVHPHAEPYPQRNLANGSVEIVCRVGEQLRIVGPRTKPTVELLAPGTAVVGARLRPEAAGTLFGVPASELVDRRLVATDLPSSDARELEKRIAETPSIEGIGRLLERALRTRSTGAPAVDPVVADTVGRLETSRHGGLRSIRSGLYLSERHFRRRVCEAVGVPPKTLERMLRFQRMLASLQLLLTRGDGLADAGVASLAAAYGYSDESHLNRECRRLTGLSIGGYLATASRDCGCGHDHSASFNRALGLST